MSEPNKTAYQMESGNTYEYIPYGHILDRHIPDGHIPGNTDEDLIDSIRAKTSKLLIFQKHNICELIIFDDSNITLPEDSLVYPLSFNPSMKDILN